MSVLVSFLVVAGAWLPGSATAVHRAETVPARVSVGHRWPARKPVMVVPTSGVWGCIIRHESRGNPAAVNPRSGTMGLVQFRQSTWDNTARHIGRPDLVGVRPSSLPASVQMQLAYALQAWVGWSPWVGDGCTPLG